MNHEESSWMIDKNEVSEPHHNIFLDENFEVEDQQAQLPQTPMNGFLFFHDSEADEEDEKLFDNVKKSEIIAEINESINDLVAKGKKNALKYEELLQRRENRKNRLQLLDEAKTHLLLHFCRAFAVMREISNIEQRSLLMSMVPDFNDEQSEPLRFT